MELLSHHALSPANSVVYHQPAVRSVHIPQAINGASVSSAMQAVQWHSFFCCRILKLPMRQ
ncbi:MAG: hypothetical protein K0R12_757 [Gammaproteobacteria bacterium]|jgi:hypothetical protein|nr:hypothetical protein [Gammaproteobacteria bacterium]